MRERHGFFFWLRTEALSVKKYVSILEADANVVLTRQNCRVNTVGNSSMTIYNKHVLERARHESEGAGALQYEIVKEIIYYE